MKTFFRVYPLNFVPFFQYFCFSFSVSSILIPSFQTNEIYYSVSPNTASMVLDAVMHMQSLRVRFRTFVHAKRMHMYIRYYRPSIQGLCTLLSLSLCTPRTATSYRSSLLVYWHLFFLYPNDQSTNDRNTVQLHLYRSCCKVQRCCTIASCGQTCFPR